MMSNLQFSPNHRLVVLAVDTSQTYASFAISCEGIIVTSHQSDDLIPHSKTFFNLLSESLKDAGLLLAEIDVFAAAIGPGSFTGLRVGLSAIKGLSHSLGKSVVGVSSIDALAITTEVTGKVLALINAGREEVYAGLREIVMGKIDGPLEADTVGKLPDVIESFKQYVMKEPLTIVKQGNCERILFDLPPHWQIVSATSNSAEKIAIYVGKTSETQTSLGLHPYYIRPSDAEIKKEAGIAKFGT